MVGLKKFLAFIADKGKKIVTDLFVKRKDTVDHLVDLCDELISENGVVLLSQEKYLLFMRSLA